MLYGEGCESSKEKDAKASDSDELSKEVSSGNLIVLLLTNIKKTEFEARKDVANILNYFVHTYPDVMSKYITANPNVLTLLVHGYESSDLALVVGLMLRELVQIQHVAKLLLDDHELFFKLFDYMEESAFSVSSDAFATFKDWLTQHQELVGPWLKEHFAAFFAKFNKLLRSPNFVTQRQSLQVIR